MKINILVPIMLSIVVGVSAMVTSCTVQNVSGSTNTRAIGGEIIEYGDAKKWIANYEKTRGVLKSKRRNGASATFSKDFIVNTILNPKVSPSLVAGLRIYVALDNKNEKDDSDRKRARIIVMPVDSNGTDLPYLKMKNRNGMDSIALFKEYFIGTSEIRCPENCGNDILGRRE